MIVFTTTIIPCDVCSGRSPKLYLVGYWHFLKHKNVLEKKIPFAIMRKSIKASKKI